MSTFLLIAAYLASGWPGARLVLLDWKRTFGDLSDAPFPLAIVVNLMGPLGLAVGGLVWALGRPRRPGATGAKFWGLS